MAEGKEKRFFDRQLRLPDFTEADLMILGSAKVLVIGIGGIGCTLADQLIRVGVGSLTLVDGDKVNYSNLARQALFTPQDVGKPKVESARKHLAGIIPNTGLITHNNYFIPELARELVPKHDLVVDCSDNFPTRYLVNDACLEFDKPFVFGGIDRDMIQWAVFNYNNGPTYRCLHPDEPLSSFIKSCDDRGVMSMTPSLLGAIQAKEAVKVLLRDKFLKDFYFHVMDTKSWQHNSFSATRSKKSSNQKIKDAYGGWCNSGRVKEIDLETANKMNALLVDVREEDEFNSFHLDQAVNIPLSRIEERTHELEVSREIVLYCKTGQRSLSGAEILRHKGFNKVFSLSSGIEEMIPDLG